MSRFNHGNNVYVTTMEDALIIRSEQSADAHAIRHIVKEAFAKAEHTDSDEHNLVERLLSTDDYIAELSLVAEINGKAVGYIMFSRIYIGPTEAVALAPLAVLPGFQNRKIGQALIQAGHHRARALGYSCSVVLGAPGYYASLSSGITVRYNAALRCPGGILHGLSVKSAYTSRGSLLLPCFQTVRQAADHIAPFVQGRRASYFRR